MLINRAFAGFYPSDIIGLMTPAASNMYAAALRFNFGAAANGLKTLFPFSSLPLAAAELFTHYARQTARTEFDFSNFMIDGKPVTIREDTVFETPFGRLTHLNRLTQHGNPINRRDPTLMIVVPQSGNGKTLMEAWFRYFAQNHNVYCVELKNAHDIPVAEGEFGYSNAIDFYEQCMIRSHKHALENGHGGRVHSMFICQPGPPAFIAAMLQAMKDAPSQPASITALACPFDVSRDPTAINDFAQISIDEIERHMINTVPRFMGYAGEGRPVYSGRLHHAACIALDPWSHAMRASDLFGKLAMGDTDAAARQMRYEEVLANWQSTCGELYLDTIARHFKSNELALGNVRHDGLPVTGAANRIPTLAIGGRGDRVVSAAQVFGIHDISSKLPDRMKASLLVKEGGHLELTTGMGVDIEAIGSHIAGFIRHAETTPNNTQNKRRLPKWRNFANSAAPAAT